MSGRQPYVAEQTVLEFCERSWDSGTQVVEPGEQEAGCAFVGASGELCHRGCGGGFVFGETGSDDHDPVCIREPGMILDILFSFNSFCGVASVRDENVLFCSGLANLSLLFLE